MCFTALPSRHRRGAEGSSDSALLSTRLRASVNCATLDGAPSRSSSLPRRGASSDLGIERRSYAKRFGASTPSSSSLRAAVGHAPQAEATGLPDVNLRRRARGVLVAPGSCHRWSRLSRPPCRHRATSREPRAMRAGRAAFRTPLASPPRSRLCSRHARPALRHATAAVGETLSEDKRELRSTNLFVNLRSTVPSTSVEDFVTEGLAWVLSSNPTATRALISRALSHPAGAGGPVLQGRWRTQVNLSGETSGSRPDMVFLGDTLAIVFEHKVNSAVNPEQLEAHRAHATACSSARRCRPPIAPWRRPPRWSRRSRPVAP